MTDDKRGVSPEAEMDLKPEIDRPMVEAPVALRLVIDAGEVAWSQFQGLATGCIVDLGVSADAIGAELHADGHPFAKAELVALLDGLGARISSIDVDG